MLHAMVLAHLLGDYVLQWDGLVRWKVRSLLGVAAHGGIVTLVTLLCATLVSPALWPYALVIGLLHTVIDLVRARYLGTPDTLWELAWYVLDQLAHLAVILLVVSWSGAPSPASLTGIARVLADPRIPAYANGYLLLLNPAWVLLRFTVRGVWGAEAAPHLGSGEKYGPMLERVLIASLVLLGQFQLAPLVLLPRRLTPIRMQGGMVGVLLRPTGHWAETLLGTALAAAVGAALRAFALAS
jgi:hypothetical protein